MKKRFFLGWLILFCAPIVLAQEKIEVPNLNVEDKWTFTDGTTMEVVGKDRNSYKVKFQNETLYFERSTLNRINMVRWKKQRTYRGPQRRLLNFPLMIGKSWKDSYCVQLKWEDEYSSQISGYSLGDETQVFESYRVLGWEDVVVAAGHFKGLKMEYKREWSSPKGEIREGKAWYWYSPEVKNFVKVRYDKSQIWSQNDDFELESYDIME